ncbi:MAG: ABC transporter ATP-binding protein [Terriglobales bacterium]|jgi:ATP-binding cassette subfamily B protein
MLRSLRPLLPYLKRYRLGYLWGGLSVVCNNATAILIPLVVGRASEDLKTGVTRDKMSHYALLLLVIVSTKGLFTFLMRWIVIGISRDIELDLRNDLFRQLERLSWSWYQRTRTGDIMARVTNDLNAVRNLLGPAFMYSANTLFFTVGALVFMCRMNPKLTVYAFLPLPVVSVLIQYFGRRIHDRFERIQAQFSDISARAQENFSAARVIRAFVQEKAEINAFEKSNREYIGRSLKLVRLLGMLWPTLEMMLGFAIVLVLWLGGRDVIRGKMEFGDFVAFNFYMIQLTFPVIALGWVVSIFQKGTASLGRIDEIMKEKPEVVDRSGGGFTGREGRPLQLNGEIEFRNLTFSYGIRSDTTSGPNGDVSHPVLQNVSLRIPAGTSLAIVGPTGSGKSTLVSLIPRIYDVSEGEVMIDGVPISDYPLEALRSNIGFVPQETFLFGDTIRQNIALGASQATMDEVRYAAEAASIDADIESFPDQYETVVGERGITLSGGQKQRTAIARALARNPRILILDDALSSVDTQTEDHILNHLREIMSDRTTIFISHRVSTVRNADRIAVLHGGHIVEFGSHDELIALDGYYADLYNKQLLEEELAEETV